MADILNPPQRRMVFYWLPVYLYMGLIFYLSSQLKPPVPYFFLKNDLVTHFLEYSVLGLLLIRALAKEYHQSSLAALKCIALCIAMLYAASDEFHQRFVFGRHPDILDWAVDSCGAAFGAFLILTKRTRNKLEWPG